MPQPRIRRYHHNTCISVYMLLGSIVALNFIVMHQLGARQHLSHAFMSSRNLPSFDQSSNAMENQRREITISMSTVPARASVHANQGSLASCEDKATTHTNQACVRNKNVYKSIQQPSENRSQINTPTWIDFVTNLASLWKGLGSQDGPKLAPNRFKNDSPNPSKKL